MPAALATRQTVDAAIRQSLDRAERLIAVLDALDGDPDFEPDADEECGGDAKPLWFHRAVLAAASIEKLIFDHARREGVTLVADRSRDGRGLCHALFMARAIQDGAHGIDSATKACRWLGYLQGMLVYEGLSTLAAEKERNLRAVAEVRG